MFHCADIYRHKDQILFDRVHQYNMEGIHNVLLLLAHHLLPQQYIFHCYGKYYLYSRLAEWHSFLQYNLLKKELLILRKRVDLTLLQSLMQYNHFPTKHSLTHIKINGN